MAAWGDLPKRAMTAAILGPLALLCVWLGSYWWTALMAICVTGLAWEWVRICGGSTRRLPGAAVPATVLIAGSAAVQGFPILAVCTLIGGALGTFAIAAKLRQASHISWFVFGSLYIGLAGIALIELRHSDTSGRDNVLFLFAVVWASDISAYAFGRWIGGPKLARAISPNKTWAGAAGGLIGAAAVGLAAAVYAGGPSAIGAAMLIAAVLGIATQLGDLFESWMKRHFGVKDSSGLIPGHGGLLDRLDGVLIAAPVAALMSFLNGPGSHLWR